MQRTFNYELDLQDFKVTYDYESIAEKMEEEKENLNPEYDRYINIGDDEEGPTLSKEECIANIDKMLSYLNIAVEPEYLKEIIEGFPKKKDGTFKKNQVKVVANCDNSYYEEDSYGYRTNVLRFKAVESDELALQYVSTVIGY